VLAGAEYLRALPYVDAKRIGIWGGSYGGLLTALALSRNSNIFAAGVDFHGIHDWSVVVRLLEEGAQDAPDYAEAVKLAYVSSPIASNHQLERGSRAAGGRRRCPATARYECRAKGYRSPFDLAAARGIGFDIERRRDQVHAFMNPHRAAMRPK